ncbi:MAG TPA: AarF/ABC1/UbiB kinase family protein [Anaerolinea thermolimosa]|uniref:AarF/ABC1/UbiB kinase family protein n=1 Tax=Anaerolinea thermolimosa TaxID=229919 RepID=A0A3D1JFD9_9CHLR|nr:AarF/UbiB family protein [Anaerolinea thermolimosa]GAP07254.1 predicted unusual protein kinase [Anaerolinea thermolimosa]HCE17222.1 AarF/ABC1/UbiB kinase family protein [Anaerolinea thermolimosa]
MLRSRYLRILWFFGRVLLQVLLWDIFLPAMGLRWMAVRNRTRRLRSIAASFRAMAIQMGGVMIKVGQFLSARLDVLPREITDELVNLQDEVRPERFEDIRRVIEEEFGEALESRFEWFNPEPLAAASIGQVHHARLRAEEGVPCTGVVVKVQRPGIDQIVAVDLAALRVVGRWIQWYEPVRKRAHVPALLEEFSHSLYEEMDYLLEGKHAETFAENFAGDAGVCVPRVIWSHTTRRVLTLEDVRAIKITDYAAIETAGLNRKEVAERLFATYLKQIFEDRFFHADPHPGNLFVSPPSQETGEPWKLIFVDFGMVGHLTETTLSGLREALIAIGTQDAGRLVRAYQQLHILLPGADLELIEKASAEAFSRFWGRTAPELTGMAREEILDFAREFRDVLYEMPFQVPENFILLGRCVSILSGICSGLDPDFNIWEQITPYTQKLVENDRGNGLRFLTTEVTDTLRILIGLPRRSDALLNRIEQGKLTVQTPELKEDIRRVEKSIRRLSWGILFAAFFLGGIQLYLNGDVNLALASGGGAFLSLLIFVFSK